MYESIFYATKISGTFKNWFESTLKFVIDYCNSEFPEFMTQLGEREKRTSSLCNAEIYALSHLLDRDIIVKVVDCELNQLKEITFSTDEDCMNDPITVYNYKEYYFAAK